MGFQPSFNDLDGDRYPELLYAADFATTKIFKNNRDGSFTQLDPSAGMPGNNYGMGQVAADFDRDGDLDWYVTSIFEEGRPNPAYHNGNALYTNTGQNEGTLSFVENSVELGLDDGGWGWGVVAADFDHDGWLDMVEANGRNSAEWALEPEYYFRSNGSGDGSFTRDLGVSSQFLNADGRTVITLDYDRDGDLDIIIYYNLGPLKLYRNDSVPARGASGHWLLVDLDDGSNPFVAPQGYGTRLVARVGDVNLVRFVDGGNGYTGSSELVTHFGLGSASTIDELRIEWARGYVTTLTNVSVDQRITIVAPALADLNADGTVSSADVAILLGAWGPVTTATLHCDLDNNGAIESADLAIVLGGWSQP